MAFGGTQVIYQTEMKQIKKEIKEEREFSIEESPSTMELDSTPLAQLIIKNEPAIEEEPQDVKEETAEINQAIPDAPKYDNPLRRERLQKQQAYLKRLKRNIKKNKAQKQKRRLLRQSLAGNNTPSGNHESPPTPSPAPVATGVTTQAPARPPPLQHIPTPAKHDWTRRVWQNRQVPGVVNRGSGNLGSAAFQFQPPGNEEAVRRSSAYGGHQQFRLEPARPGCPRAFGNGGIPSAVIRDYGHTSGLAPLHFVVQGGDAGGHVGQRGLPGDSQFYYHPENQQFHNYHHHNYANFTGQDDHSRLNINNRNYDSYMHYFHYNDPSGHHGPQF